MKSVDTTAKETAPIVIGLLVAGGLAWIVRHYAVRFLQPCTQVTGNQQVCSIALDIAQRVSK